MRGVIIGERGKEGYILAYPSSLRGRLVAMCAAVQHEGPNFRPA